VGREGEEINAVVDKSKEGSLKGKGSVRFPPLYQLVLHQLLFALKILFTFFTKQGNLMRRSRVLCLPLQLVFPDKSESD
jgi:hypothetical protein